MIKKNMYWFIQVMFILIMTMSPVNSMGSIFEQTAAAQPRAEQTAAVDDPRESTPPLLPLPPQPRPSRPTMPNESWAFILNPINERGAGVFVKKVSTGVGTVTEINGEDIGITTGCSVICKYDSPTQPITQFFNSSNTETITYYGDTFNLGVQPAVEPPLPPLPTRPVSAPFIEAAPAESFTIRPALLMAPSPTRPVSAPFIEAEPAPQLPTRPPLMAAPPRPPSPEPALMMAPASPLRAEPEDEGDSSSTTSRTRADSITSFASDFDDATPIAPRSLREDEFIRLFPNLQAFRTGLADVDAQLQEYFDRCELTDNEGNKNEDLARLDAAAQLLQGEGDAALGADVTPQMIRAILNPKAILAYSVNFEASLVQILAPITTAASADKKYTKATAGLRAQLIDLLEAFVPAYKEIPLPELEPLTTDQKINALVSFLAFPGGDDASLQRTFSQALLNNYELYLPKYDDSQFAEKIALIKANIARCREEAPTELTRDESDFFYDLEERLDAFSTEPRARTFESDEAITAADGKGKISEAKWEKVRAETEAKKAAAKAPAATASSRDEDDDGAAETAASRRAPRRASVTKGSL